MSIFSSSTKTPLFFCAYFLQNMAKIHQFIKCLQIPLLKKERYFAVFMFLAKAKEYNLTDFNVISKLCFAYNNTEKWEQDYKEHPYVMLSEKTDWAFNKIDKTVLSALPEFNESKERTQYCIYDYLKANELDNHTNGQTLPSEVK